MTWENNLDFQANEVRCLSDNRNNVLETWDLESYVKNPWNGPSVDPNFFRQGKQYVVNVRSPMATKESGGNSKSESWWEVDYS